MKKVIRLTESDLIKIVKRVIKEQQVDLGDLGYQNNIDVIKNNSESLKSKLEYCKSISSDELCVSTGYHDSKGNIITTWGRLNKILHQNGYEQKKGPSYKVPENLDLNSTVGQEGGPYMITAIFTNK